MKNIKFYDKKNKMQGYRAISTAENAACTGHANLMDNIAAKNQFSNGARVERTSLSAIKIVQLHF